MSPVASRRNKIDEIQAAVICWTTDESTLHFQCSKITLIHQLASKLDSSKNSVALDAIRWVLTWFVTMSTIIIKYLLISYGHDH